MKNISQVNISQNTPITSNLNKIDVRSLIQAINQGTLMDIYDIEKARALLDQFIGVNDLENEGLNKDYSIREYIFNLGNEQYEAVLFRDLPVYIVESIYQIRSGVFLENKTDAEAKQILHALSKLIALNPQLLGYLSRLFIQASKNIGSKKEKSTETQAQPIKLEKPHIKESNVNDRDLMKIIRPLLENIKSGDLKSFLLTIVSRILTEKIRYRDLLSILAEKGISTINLMDPDPKDIGFDIYKILAIQEIIIWFLENEEPKRKQITKTTRLDWIDDYKKAKQRLLRLLPIES